tara:strand:+ start:2520 stop:3758 length:1239 start_codon:yes stop_codon:yes gene_type:complete
MMFETFIGLRYLKARKRTTFISVITLISILGVTLGVATLSVVLSVMNGFQHELINKVIGANSHAILFRYGVDFSDHEEVRKKVVATPGITSASPIVLGEVMLSAGEKMIGVGLKGISLKHPIHLQALKRNKVGKKGSLQRLIAPHKGALPGIAIGKALAEKLQVKQGDVVNMISPITLFGLSNRTQASHRSFKVAYIFQFGMNQYDSKFCFISLKQAQSFFKLKRSVTGLEFFVDDLHRIDFAKAHLNKTLGGWPYRIQDWRQMNQNLFKAIQQNKLALGLILLFIILVASLNIAGTLILMVLEKSKDIAILRTMGSSKQSVIRIFMTYGLYISSLGTMAGLVLGLLLCQVATYVDFKLDASVYFISHLPVRIHPMELVVVAISSLLISFLATIYPALQAARQRPVEVLRYE